MPEIQLEPNEHQTIVDQVAAFIRRFVYLKEPELYGLIAIWIIGTHLHQGFEYYGYLFVHSPEKQCGKTRLLEILDLLVFESSGIQVSPTEATLFRMASGRTQLLDEVDSWSNRDYCGSFLNAGFQRGASVPRMEQNASGQYVERKFQIYGPKVLAGIGSHILSDITKDRVFEIEMIRRGKNKPVEKFRPRFLDSDIEVLKKAITSFAEEHRVGIQLRYDTPDLPYLKRFSDRTEDIVEPLAVTLDEIYKERPQRDEVLADFLKAIELTRNEDGGNAGQREVLLDLMEAARQAGGSLVGTAKELAVECGKTIESNYWLGVTDVLRKYGFKTKSTRLNGGDPRKRYEITLQELEEIYKRYFSTSEKAV